MDNLANFAISAVAAAPSPATSGTSLTVTTGQGSRFPSGSFDCTFYPPGVQPDASNAEICRVTISGDVMTLTRAQYGTTAKSIAVGWIVDNAPTANLLSQVLDLAGTRAMTGPITGFQDKGGQVFNVVAYGAKGDGITDDTTACSAALTAASIHGGEVRVPSPAVGYLISSSLAIPDGVTVVGVSSYLGAATFDTLKGSIFLVKSATAFDPFTSTSTKGSGLVRIIVDCQSITASYSTKWALHLKDCVGFVTDNFAWRSSGFNGMNGIWLNGAVPASGGCYGCWFSNISLDTGGGYTGGTGIRFGNLANTIPANANGFSNAQIQGMSIGIDFDYGGGNVGMMAWTQSCTTGVIFNSSLCALYGGWSESNTLGFSFTASSVRCLVDGMRMVGNTTPYTITAGAVSPRFHNTDYNPGGAVAGWSLGASTVAWINNTGFDGTLYTTGAGTVTAVSVNGVVLSATLAIGDAYRVVAGGTFQVTYAVAPTLVFVGD